MKIGVLIQFHKSLVGLQKQQKGRFTFPSLMIFASYTYFLIVIPRFLLITC